MTVKVIQLALIQEPSCRDGCVSGLNIPGYTLYSAKGKDRPTACTLGRDMDIWDLAIVLVKYIENGADRRLITCSAYLPYDSEDKRPSPQQGSWRTSCDIVKKNRSSFWWGVIVMRTTLHGVAPIAMVEERLLLNFLISLPWRSSIGAGNPPSLIVLDVR
jgi:hypothetical protein